MYICKCLCVRTWYIFFYFFSKIGNKEKSNKLDKKGIVKGETRKKREKNIKGKNVFSFFLN